MIPVPALCLDFSRCLEEKSLQPFSCAPEKTLSDLQQQQHSAQTETQEIFKGGAELLSDLHACPAEDKHRQTVNIVC